MDTNTAITLAKSASVIISSALGLAALLGNYRDASGALTPWGIGVLAGLALSAFTGVAASLMEGNKARSESAEQAARSERLLRELSRSIR
jgi:hypothetical protein